MPYFSCLQFSVAIFLVAAPALLAAKNSDFHQNVSLKTAQLELKRVTLSSSGVGYFEFEAQVERDALLRLPVKLDQVDDVLKSLVVYDDKGQIAGMSLPGKEPLSELLRALPFDAAALSSTANLLTALPGAQIRVKSARGQFVGRIAGVVNHREPHEKSGSVSRHLASVMTAQGVRSFFVEDSQVEFEDKLLKAQIDQALAAMAANRGKDGRTLEINTRGVERRTVRVGYVTSVPIWKTAYRLTIPSENQSLPSDQKALLQGWAVIENMSGQDWRGVELTLTSGKPVAFRQSLYESYYNQRPSVPIEMPGRIVPRADFGTVQVQQYAAAPAYAPAYSPSYPAAITARSAPPAPAPAPAPAAAPVAPRAYMPQSVPPPALNLAQVADPANAQDQGTQMSYRFPLPVDVSNGRSLSVPIIVQNLSAQRVAQYQPKVSSQLPLAALELANHDANALPAGAVTVYEQSANKHQGATFLGDAQLAVLPAGEKRLLPFAIDQKISIITSTREAHASTRVATEGARLLTENVHEYIHSYQIKSARTTGSEVIVELPRYMGYALKVPSGKSLGETPSSWRVSLGVPAKGALAHELRQEKTWQSHQPLDQMLPTALREALPKAKDEASAQVLRRLLALREAQEAIERDIDLANEEINTQHTEQARYRENLNTLSKGTELYQRYQTSMVRAEDRIVAALKKRDHLTDSKLKANTSAQEFLKSL